MPAIDHDPLLEALVARLLAWIQTARRDLPWRRQRDAYPVLVSEIMLQQTQVATVVPYFERWLARFPDFESLAAAPIEDVLKAWEGLGYYARARHLHAIAQRVVADFGGRLPAEREALLRLPGIGRYTAGAILSLAYGQHEPVLDGNVRRVLCRLYDVDEDPHMSAVEKRLWERTTALVEAAPAGRAGDLNEALMELGALICTPARPACEACPLHSQCLAYRHGTQAMRPVQTPRAPIPHYAAVAAVIRDDRGRYLLARRPAKGLLGGLWEFPGERAGIPAERGISPSGLADLLRDIVAKKLGVALTPGPPEPLLQIPHTYTHFRITLHVYRAVLGEAEPQPVGYEALAWVSPEGLAAYALPKTDQKIASVLTTNMI